MRMIPGHRNADDEWTLWAKRVFILAFIGAITCVTLLVTALVFGVIYFARHVFGA